MTIESVECVQARLHLKSLPYNALKQGSVLNLPFDDNSFDIVFSHGVLHHVPDIQQAQSEIARVLKPTGKLVAMLYAKYSLNYLLAISVIRRIGLAGLYWSGRNPGGMFGQHLANAEQIGLFEYLKMTNIIHRNTDGPLNPYSKVYDLKTVAHDFPKFRVLKSAKHLMHAPPLSVDWLPLARYFGWHLWVHMEPIEK